MSTRRMYWQFTFSGVVVGDGGRRAKCGNGSRDELPRQGRGDVLEQDAIGRNRIGGEVVGHVGAGRMAVTARVKTAQAWAGAARLLRVTIAAATLERRVNIRLQFMD